MQCYCVIKEPVFYWACLEQRSFRNTSAWCFVALCKCSSLLGCCMRSGRHGEASKATWGGRCFPNEIWLSGLLKGQRLLSLLCS